MKTSSFGTILLALLAGSCGVTYDSSIAPSWSGLGAPPRFAAFESGQVRPLALSPNGSRLYAVNTPAARLEIFDVTSAGLTHQTSVPVGLEPVAVAARS